MKEKFSGTDLKGMRVGEEIDGDALRRYLVTHLPELAAATSNFSGDIEQFSGGHSNLTYLINAGSNFFSFGEEFVLRRPPVGPVAPTAHDMPREFHLLQAIHPHFALAPRPILLCEDASVIGAPFYLMERRSGLIVRNRIPHEIGDDPEQRRRVSEAVVDTLAALHAVDIYSTGLAKIGKPTGFVERQVRGWTERWVRSKTSEVPAMDQVARWLADWIPTQSETGATIVHNDFKLDNIMLDTGDPSRVVAVLDWEMCSVGDPLIDLGLLLCYWTLKSADDRRSLRVVTTGPGWMTREEIIERYARQTGRNLSHIAFYETFARFKVAVIIQQIYFRFVRGQTSDQRFQHFDQLVLELAQEAVLGLGS
jgi:aminoglycoside phosphotransferase (APT) family kinase protein